MNQTRTQKYAGIAMVRVREVATGRPPDKRKEYKSRADSGPTMVMQAGLAQMLGFLCGKGDMYSVYADDIALVLGKKNAAVLHETAIKATLPEYRRLTREVLEAGALIKRFAQIELDVEDDTKDSDARGGRS